MKRKIKFVSGFTIAELLISMLVSAVLIAALVPVVGVKKIKYPIHRYSHGIAECYYNDAGQLTYYYEINRNSERNQERVVGGNHCTFAVPKAQYFQIFVIGAGGNSSGADITSVTDANLSSITTNIYPYGTYQQDIDSADSQYPGLSQMIRKALTNWSSQGGTAVEYTITSPAGKGGPGVCKAVQIRHDDICNSNCANGFNNASCIGPLKSPTPNNINNSFSSYSRAVFTMNLLVDDPGYCWAYIHGQGQSSGDIGTINYTAYLTGDTQIEVTENSEKAGLSITDGDDTQYLYLLSSGSGAAATWNADDNAFELPNSNAAAATCNSNIDGICNSMVITEGSGTPGSPGGYEQPAGFGCSQSDSPSSNARNGSVRANQVSPYTFVSSFHPLVLNVDYQKAGVYGGVKTRIFEKLSGSLDLYPAASVEDPESYVVSRDDADGERLLSANSGRDGEADSAKFRFSASNIPVSPEMKREAKPDNEIQFSEYLATLAASRFEGGIKAQCFSPQEGQDGLVINGNCPGFAGSAPYLYLTINDVEQVSNRYALTLTNLQTHETYNDAKDILIQPNAEGCAGDETQKPVGDFGGGSIKVDYCSPSVDMTRGRPGAVIIVW